MTINNLLKPLALTTLLITQQAQASDVLIKINSEWEGNTLSLNPTATSQKPGTFQYLIEVQKSGKQGSATTRQSSQTTLSPNRQTRLSSTTFNLMEGDQLSFKVTLTSEGNSVAHLERLFTLPSKHQQEPDA
ncbi:curli-like amyloid fiber formation chaperone CsgH [Endozoicomonas numazuensis]|uniref:Curli assembly protein CsgC n=1 Tax=Endozoicomonas numazuensis TaxID=1137799 RepID=A0A081NL16_9GAMM|nr:curli-like amyloid fiber formation chaperone CsgH [Endozoicomonas numazuensis]KEQ19139.1 hypothetical protein GZ78_03800 [Endozoicomonas numazuensis]